MFYKQRDPQRRVWMFFQVVDQLFIMGGKHLVHQGKVVTIAELGFVSRIIEAVIKIP